MLKAEWKRLFQSRYMKWIFILFFLYCCLSSFSFLFDPKISTLNESMANIQDWDLENDEFVEANITLINDEELINRIDYAIDAKKNAGERYRTLSKMEKSALFSDENDQLEITAEAKVVKQMAQDSVCVVNDIVALSVFDVTKVDTAVILVIGFYVVYSLFTQDHDESLVRLFDSTKKSRFNRIISKICVFLFVIFVLSSLKYICNVITIKLSGIDINMPIHYLYDFDQMNVYWSVIVYFSVLTVLKLFTILLVLSFFTFLSLMTNNTNISLLMCTLLLIVEVIIDKFVSTNSSISFLKRYNLFSYLWDDQLSSAFFSHFGLSIADPFVMLCILLLLILIVYIIVLFIYGKEINLFHKKQKIKTWKEKSYTFFRVRELLITRKGFLIYLFVLAYCLINMYQYKVVRSTRDIEYESFRQQYFGEITDERIQKVESELQDASEAYKQLNDMLNQFAIDDYENMSEETLEQLTTLQQRSSKLALIEKVNTEIQEFSSNGATYYYADDGMELFMNKNGSIGGYIEYLLIFVPVILMSVIMVSQMYQTKIYHLFFSSKMGQKKILYKQFVHLLFYAGLFYITVFLIRYLKINRYYAISINSENASNILGVKFSYPLLVYLLIMVVSQFVYISVLIRIAMWISKYLDSITSSAIMLMITIISVLIPYGPGILFRYDFVNHWIQYILVINGCVIFFMLSRCYHKKNSVPKQMVGG